MTRRGAFLALVPLVAGAEPHTWTMENFVAFMEELNVFIMRLNHGVHDQKQWVKVEKAWERLEGR